MSKCKDYLNYKLNQTKSSKYYEFFILKKIKKKTFQIFNICIFNNICLHMIANIIILFYQFFFGTTYQLNFHFCRSCFKAQTRS